MIHPCYRQVWWCRGDIFHPLLPGWACDTRYMGYDDARKEPRNAASRKVFCHAHSKCAVYGLFVCLCSLPSDQRVTTRGEWKSQCGIISGTRAALTQKLSMPSKSKYKKSSKFMHISGTWAELTQNVIKVITLPSSYMHISGTHEHSHKSFQCHKSHPPAIQKHKIINILIYAH